MPVACMNHYWSIENRMKWTGLKGDAQVKSITFKGCNLAEQKEPFDIFNIIFGTNLHNWNFILLQYLRWRCNEFWSLKRQPKKNWRYPETEQKSKRIKPSVLRFTILSNRYQLWKYHTETNTDYFSTWISNLYQLC